MLSSYQSPTTATPLASSSTSQAAEITQAPPVPIDGLIPTNSNHLGEHRTTQSNATYRSTMLPTSTAPTALALPSSPNDQRAPPIPMPGSHSPTLEPDPSGITEGSNDRYAADACYYATNFNNWELKLMLVIRQNRARRLENQLYQTTTHVARRRMEVADLNTKLNDGKKTFLVTEDEVFNMSISTINELRKDRAKAERVEDASKAETTAEDYASEAERYFQLSSLVYTGPLKSRSKKDLLDILFSLSLVSTLPEAVVLVGKGTKLQLMERIERFLRDHPLLATNPQFEGIYPACQVLGKRKTENDENDENDTSETQWPSSRSRLAQRSATS